MNISFKLGKVNIPVTEEHNIEIKDLKIAVEDYNLMEGLEIMKEIPFILADLQAVLHQSESLTGCDFSDKMVDKNEEEEESVHEAPVDLFDLLAKATNYQKQQEEEKGSSKSLADLLISHGKSPSQIKLIGGGSLADLLKGLSKDEQ
jgi:hypothetical protein